MGEPPHRGSEVFGKEEDGSLRQNTGHSYCGEVWCLYEEMIDAIENEYFIHILPLKEEHMKKYSELELNVAQDHKDPSDHVIIAHAITEGLPLISDDRKFEFYRKQGLDLIVNRKEK